MKRTTKKTTKKTAKRAKRFASFTMKISIDYLLRGYCMQHNITDPKQVLDFLVAHRQELAEIIRKRFVQFCQENGVSQASCILHNKDTHINKAGKRVPDDWHMHFIVICNNSKKTSENTWRKRLEDCKLYLSDTNRTQKDIEELKKPDLPHAFAYQIHRTPKAIKDGKHAYDQDDIWLYNFTADEVRDLLIKGGVNSQDTSIKFINFNSDNTKNKKLQTDTANIVKYMKDLKGKDKKALDEQMDATANAFTDLIRKGMSVQEVKDRTKEIFQTYHAAFWRRYHKAFENEEQEYVEQLMQQMPYHTRNLSFIYIHGRGGTGKSVIADHLAYFFADKQTHAVHSVAPNGKRKTFDIMSNYNNELVSVAHELNPTAIGVDEFENLAEPHRYPNVNSRNHDRGYFTQALIVTKALATEDWIYTLIYADYLKYGRDAYKYGYKDEIQRGKNGEKTETLDFPHNFFEFYDAFCKQDSKYWDHWSFKGADRFFNDFWQILRRMTYTFDIVPVENENEKNTHEISIEVYKLNGNEMKKVECWDDFEFNTTLLNFYEKVGSYYISNFLDNADTQHALTQIVKALKQKGMIIEPALPKLLPANELDKLISGNSENLDSTSKEKDNKTALKSDDSENNESKANNDIISLKEASDFAKEQYGF